MFDDLKLFVSRIDNFQQSRASDKIDLFAYYLTRQREHGEFTSLELTQAFTHLKLASYSNIPQYLKDNSDKARPKKKKIKFLKKKSGYCLECHFEQEISAALKDQESTFIEYNVNSEQLDWKPSDIPFLNTKMRRNAHFFTKLYFLLYHLENSLRKFVAQRLSSILGNDWEIKLLGTVELGKAEAIRREVGLSEMLPERGDHILYYCMWDDYGKIIKVYPTILSNTKEADELMAHLGSLSKIRNAIAHNAVTIPSEYQDELTVFLRKFIKIMKTHVQTVNVV